MFGPYWTHDEEKHTHDLSALRTKLDNSNDFEILIAWNTDVFLSFKCMLSIQKNHPHFISVAGRR